jgi:hypothetical protein
MRGMVLINRTRQREKPTASKETSVDLVLINHQASPLHEPQPKMPSEPDGKQDKRENAAQARQVIDVFHEISTLLVPHVSPLLDLYRSDYCWSRMQTSTDKPYLSAYP